MHFLLRLYPFLTLYLKMGSGICHFYFPFQLQICWDLSGLCSIGSWFMSISQGIWFWCLLAPLGASGLLMRIVLTNLYHWEAQGSAAVLFSD